MDYVYVLQSKKGNRLYIGCTGDLRNRFRLHNAGKVKSTKGYKPWRLVYYEAYRVKSEATKRERELKMHAVKEELKERIKESLKD